MAQKTCTECQWCVLAKILWLATPMQQILTEHKNVYSSMQVGTYTKAFALDV